MPRLKPIRKAAIEREQKKKILRKLVDPLAWTFQDPWKNPVESSSTDHNTNTGRNEPEANQELSAPISVGIAHGTRTKGDPLVINSLSSGSRFSGLQPQVTPRKKHEADVYHNGQFRDRDSEKLDTSRSSTMATVRQPPNAAVFAKRGPDGYPIVPLISQQTAHDQDDSQNELNSTFWHVRDGDTQNLDTPRSSTMTTVRQPPDAAAIAKRKQDGSPIVPLTSQQTAHDQDDSQNELNSTFWLSRNENSQNFDALRSGVMTNVHQPPDVAIEVHGPDSNLIRDQIVPIDMDTDLPMLYIEYKADSAAFTNEETFTVEDLPEIALPELMEPPINFSNDSGINASFVNNDINKQTETPRTLTFWQRNKLISLSRSSLRIVELPGVPHNETTVEPSVKFADTVPKSSCSLDPYQISQTRIKQWKKLEGRRIVDYDYFIKWLVLSQAAHSKTCDGILCPFQENFKSMISTVWLKCNTCEEVLYGYSEDPSAKYSLRYSVAWAIPNSGTTYTCMHEIFSFLNMPFVDRNTVAKDELRMHQIIDEALEDSLDAAIEEEKAIVKEEMRQKGLTITEDAPIESCAEVDGSWGQRSNGHRYSSASGCAVIVGVRSKKVCFVGCRNKRCAVCSRNQKMGKNKKTKKHRCFRNFFGASGGMEPDIAIEGFEKVHRKGLKFTTVITDGDCTTVAKIKNSCKYGHEINHQLCCNHNLKSLGKKLRDIKVPKLYRDLVPKAIDRITGGMRGAMAHCASSTEVDKVEKLRLDLINAAYHAFGIHNKCRNYFCTKETKPEDLEFFEKLKATPIWEKIMAAVESVAAKAESLSENRTSNLAENVFCQLCKFNVGKRVNTMSRGSYEMRVKITVLHKNDKYKWHTEYMEMFVGMPPGYWLLKMFREKEGSRRRTNASRSRPGYSRKKAKSSTKPDVECDYGQMAVERMEERTTNNEIDKSKISALYELSKESKIVLTNSISLTNMEGYAKGRILTKFVPDIVGAQSKTLPKKADLMLQNMHNHNLLKSNKASVGKILRLVESDLNLKLRGTRFFVDECHNYLCCAPDAISDDNQTILLIRKLPKSKFDPNSPSKSSENEAQAALHTCKATKCIMYYIYGTQNSPIGYHIFNSDNDHFSNQIESKLKLFFEEHVMNLVFTQNTEIKK